MKMPEIRERARELGIHPGKVKKTDLIHSIQEAEGNYPCYGTCHGNCDHLDCCWRTDCLKIK